MCGMTVDTARAEKDGPTIDHDGRMSAFCRTGCLRAFRDDPDTYRARGDVAPTDAAGARHDALPRIGDGMRLWYENCSCCLSDAFPEVKAALDAERSSAVTSY